jgi:predicted ABC-type ATPase
MPASGTAARPFIFVLAGVNGAGKSSVGGAMLAEYGLTWFNPDSFARELTAQFSMTPTEANSRAWETGRAQLDAAMADGKNYAFETTLGGRTIPDMLANAARTHDVVILFCGLSSVEQHIERVRLRVTNKGHAIPENKIRERWVKSRANLIKLLPHLTRLQVFDNSVDAAPGQDIPDPVLVLEMVEAQVIFPDQDDTTELSATPEWARPIVQAALESQHG